MVKMRYGECFALCIKNTKFPPFFPNASVVIGTILLYHNKRTQMTYNSFWKDTQELCQLGPFVMVRENKEALINLNKSHAMGWSFSLLDNITCTSVMTFEMVNSNTYSTVLDTDSVISGTVCASSFFSYQWQRENVKYFMKCKRMGNFVHIWNQHRKYINMSTNNPRFGPVVLEIAHVFCINTTDVCR